MLESLGKCVFSRKSCMLIKGLHTMIQGLTFSVLAERTVNDFMSALSGCSVLWKRTKYVMLSSQSSGDFTSQSPAQNLCNSQSRWPARWHIVTNGVNHWNTQSALLIWWRWQLAPSVIEQMFCILLAVAGMKFGISKNDPEWHDSGLKLQHDGLVLRVSPSHIS